jgi:hypothetical protein
MKLIPTKLRLLALAAGSLAIMTAGAHAQNFAFANGDLILGFQATGGTGNTTNVFFNLGSTTAIRDNPLGAVNTGNINTDLEAAFGAGWFNRDDLWVGAFGNLNAHPNTGIGSRPAVDGDPSRTIYLSRAASAPEAAASWNNGSPFTSNQLGAAGGNFGGMETFLPTLTATASGTTSITEAGNPVQWSNSWTAWNPTPGAAFQTFNGGIQNSFGQAGNFVYLDIQRILATTTGADPTGSVGQGDYITTVAIGSDGSIAAIPEPSTFAMLGLAAGAVAFGFLRRRKSNA